MNAPCPACKRRWRIAPRRPNCAALIFWTFPRPSIGQPSTLVSIQRTMWSYSLQIYSLRRALTFGKSEYNRIGKLCNAQAAKRYFGGKPDAFQAEFEGSKVDGGSEEEKGAENEFYIDTRCD